MNCHFIPGLTACRDHFAGSEGGFAFDSFIVLHHTCLIGPPKHKNYLFIINRTIFCSIKRDANYTRSVAYGLTIQANIRVDRQGSQDYSEIRPSRDFNKNFPRGKLI
jgi:hypothetical protein